MNKEEIFNILYGKEKLNIWKSFKNIENSVEDSNELYKYYSDIREMLDDDKSYIRMRGFKIICKLAKWDTENQINNDIDMLLSVLDDDNPTIVRQCLSSLNSLIIYKRELLDTIKVKIENIDVFKYKDTMRPLIEKDVNAILENI